MPLYNAWYRLSLVKISPMQEINPIKNKIADLKSRGDALRRYL